MSKSLRGSLGSRSSDSASKLRRAAPALIVDSASESGPGKTDQSTVILEFIKKNRTKH